MLSVSRITETGNRGGRKWRYSSRRLFLVRRQKVMTRQWRRYARSLIRTLGSSPTAQGCLLKDGGCSKCGRRKRRRRHSSQITFVRSYLQESRRNGTTLIC